MNKVYITKLNNPSSILNLINEESVLLGISYGISISNMCESKVEIEFKENDDFNYVPLNKSDVIAIAKALGVTANDLK